ncbi:IS3 family transposase [Mucilaginibacter robiniae]|uniref:IS3 family transposase n=1 Tax=Mucilaginibacter robiniae TaxID=2728022 RepID=UPI002006F00B|nr:IS3 family transposase [Mucilaginibacter robiniae]
MKAHKTEFTVEKTCKVLGVSSSSYYYGLKHPVSVTELKSQVLLSQIESIYRKSRCCYGSPRIAIEPEQVGIHVSRPCVAKAMKRANLKSIVQERKYRVQTTDSRHTYAVAENHLGQDFAVDRLAQKWVSDLTYIKTGEGWLYLTTIIDLVDRKVTRWALSETMKAIDATLAAFKMAVNHRPVVQQLSLCSDRGVQYACSDFTELLKKYPEVTAKHEQKR